MGNDASVAGARAWCLGFVIAFVLETLFKWVIAAHLPPFGDAAFYWLESRHLAWGYSDLPGMTAWLIAFGEAVAGHSLLGMRWPFLLLGSSVPWLVVAFTRRHFGARAGWQAGLLTLGLPMAGSLGVLALPDVALTAAIMLAVLALDRALDDNHWASWLGLAVALVVAQASHYRAAMLLLAGLVLVVTTARGRTVWRRPRWYVALLLGALGAVPILVYNLRHAWAGLEFQALDRNPWSFQVAGLHEPLVQALVVTPLLYLLVLAALWLAWRRGRRGAPWDLIGVVGGVFLVGYFLIGLFADTERFHAHWPLPGYLPLLAVVAYLAQRLWRAERWRPSVRGLLLVCWLCLAGAQLATLALLAAFAFPGGPPGAPGQQAIGNVFAGWQPATRQLRQLRTRPALQDAVLVADNFRLAAELAWGLDGRVPVYSLDSPLNRKHGRAVQMRDWHLDEAGLFAAHAGQRVVLVVGETALRARQQPHWLGSVCSRFDQLEPLARVDVGPEKRIALYQGRLRMQPRQTPQPRDACIVWRRAWAAMQGRRSKQAGE